MWSFSGSSAHYPLENRNRENYLKEKRRQRISQFVVNANYSLGIEARIELHEMDCFEKHKSYERLMALPRIAPGRNGKGQKQKEAFLMDKNLEDCKKAAPQILLSMQT